MDKLKYIKLEQQDGSYSESIPLAVDSDYVDVNGETLTTKLDEKADASDLNTLTSRVDNLAHLEEGSTTGDAELIDGRVDRLGNTYASIGNAIRYTDIGIHNTLLKDNFHYSNLWEECEIYGATTYENQYNNGRDRSDGSGFYTKNFILTESIVFYFDETLASNLEKGYYTITIYPGTEEGIMGTRYRYMHLTNDSSIEENTMPTFANKLIIPANRLIALTIQWTETQARYHDFPCYFTSSKISSTLNDNVELVNNQKKSCENYLYKKKNYFNITPTTIEFSRVPGAYVDEYGAIVQLGYYDIYYFIATEDFTMGFEDIVAYNNTSSTYFQVSLHKNHAFNPKENHFKARYRNLDNTLPSTLSVKKNDIVAFSVGAANPNIINCSNNYSILQNGGILKDNIITSWEDISNNILLLKQNYLEYDNINDKLYIYIPTIIGYVRYEFTHDVFPNINADIWRIDLAKAFDDNFNFRYTLTTSGEWELAVHLANRDDFSGGRMHGDEIYTNISFFVDGVKTNLNTIMTRIPFTTLNIVQNSNLYDPNDHTTIIAEHNSEHIFSKDGLKIKQNCIWKVVETLTSCYMAMHPPAKACTDHMYLNDKYIDEAITFGNKPGVTDAVIYGENSGVYTKFGVEKYPEIAYFLITDNGGGDYNKCYYKINCEGQSSSIGLKWETITNYNFIVGK